LSSITIQDGGGSGVLAEVSKNQRLQTLAVIESIAAHHAFGGEAYNYNTGSLTLTDANVSGMAYLKNNEDETLVITAFFYLLGDNTGSTSGNHLVEIIRNPTAGTIISDATDQIPVNRDFGSNKTLTALSYKGGQGKTLTGGSVAIESIFPSTGRYTVSVGAIVLRKGNSVGVRVTPAAGTTDMDVQIAMSLYRSTESTQGI